MGQDRKLVYFGHAPMEGPGSAIIVLRHLRRLATKGWRITIFSDWGQNLECCRREEWLAFNLPHRKWWWPPYNAANPILRKLRLWLWAGECSKLLNGRQPAAALTYLSAFTDFMSQVALAYAQRYGVPLSVIAHDDPACFTDSPSDGLALREHYQNILARSHQNWFASPQLAALYDLPKSRRTTLPPIPDGYRASPKWRQDFTTSPLVIYAGNYWTAQLSLFERISYEIAAAGGRFMLMVKRNAEIEALCRRGLVLWQEPFKENREALAFMAESAAGLLVSYSESSDAMPWIRTSFPSKLIEYTHLGLPILIYAPVDSAVGEWAKRHSYVDFASPEIRGAVTHFVQALKNEEDWIQRAARSKDLANAEFDPEKIQKTFEGRLRRREADDNGSIRID